nr:undecaprenyl-diphosphate phosphatase [Clostridia bacterium]
MSYLFAVISGLIQGFTEFLPISSSGHLSLFNAVFGGCESSFTFDVMLHLATLAAVFIVYRSDIFLLVRSFFSLTAKLISRKYKRSGISQDERYVVSVLLATVPM